MAERHTRIRGKQIVADTVAPSDLKSTNSEVDGYIAKYDSATSSFTWITHQGLFEIDGSGDLQPVTESNTDEYFELDGSDDIQPKSA